MRNRILASFIMLFFTLMITPAVFAALSIPDDLKDDIVAPPGSTIEGSKNEPVYVEIASSQSLKDAAGYYKDLLLANGWKLAGEFPNPAEKTHQLLMQKDGKTLAIGIGLKNNGNSITRILLQ